MDERARKIGENEALYRAVNERIEDLNQAFGTLTDTMTVVCECGDATCALQIDLPVSEYERIRSDSTLFVVRPGHEIEDVEEVVAEGDAHSIVRKNPGGPAELADALDPRSR
jgi:hypothetical protein